MFDVGVAHDFPNWDEKNKSVGNYTIMSIILRIVR